MTRFYFDHNATTPVAPEVTEAMSRLVTEVFGNASSIHYFGQQAKQRLELARRQVAQALNADPKQIVFTSGGTESDNLAVLGAVRACERRSRHVVTTEIEHPAVLASCAKLQREGIDVTRVAVGASGVVDPDDVRRAMRDDTVLVTVMHANNELGTLQPVADLARIAHDRGALFHSDGVQAAGKAPRPEIADLYSITAHKMYGPKGIGALCVRQGVALEPLLYGGRHEQGRRPGTENVFLAAALGVTIDRMRREGPAENARIAELRDRLERGVLERVPDARANGASSPRLPNTTNIAFDGIDSDAMVIALDLRGFAVSGGAACSSGSTEPSHVLLAIGLTREQARSSIRFSLGRDNTVEQVDALIEAVAESVAHLRKLSPTYSGSAR